MTGDNQYRKGAEGLTEDMVRSALGNNPVCIDMALATIRRTYAIDVPRDVFVDRFLGPVLEYAGRERGLRLYQLTPQTTPEDEHDVQPVIGPPSPPSVVNEDRMQRHLSYCLSELGREVQSIPYNIGFVDSVLGLAAECQLYDGSLPETALSGIIALTPLDVQVKLNGDVTGLAKVGFAAEAFLMDEEQLSRTTAMVPPLGDGEEIQAVRKQSSSKSDLTRSLEGAMMAYIVPMGGREKLEAALGMLFES